jgi:hypothetical protein
MAEKVYTYKTVDWIAHLRQLSASEAAKPADQQLNNYPAAALEKLLNDYTEAGWEFVEFLDFVMASNGQDRRSVVVFKAPLED